MVSSTAIAKSAHGSARSYFSKVASMDYLDVDQEYKYAELAAEFNDENARKALVDSHLRLVVKMAMPYEKFGFNGMELISAGNVGLLKAVDKFERQKGFRFATYAQWWIKASIMEYMLENRSIIRIPTSALNKKIVMLLSRQKGNIANGNGHLVYRKVAKATGATDEYVSMIAMLMSGVQSMQTKINRDENESSELGDFIADEGPLQDEIVESNDEMDKRRAILQEAITTLKDREKLIFFARRIDEDKKTLEELAADLGITRERVRQIEVKAYEKVEAAVKKIVAASETGRIERIEQLKKERLEQIAATAKPVRPLPSAKRQKSWTLQRRGREEKLVYA